MYYGFIANELHTVCSSITQLNLLEKVTTYPTWQVFKTKKEAWAWVNRSKRSFIPTSFKNYSRYYKHIGSERVNVITVSYFIKNGTIYYDLDTSKVGFVKLQFSHGLTGQLEVCGHCKYKYKCGNIDDKLISSHVTAISIIVDRFPDWMGFNIIVPDFSVYLAASRHFNNLATTGKSNNSYHFIQFTMQKGE